MEIIFEMNILLIIGLPLWIIIRGVILLFRRKKGDKLNLYKEIITNLFVIYLFILIGVTIFPLRIGSTIPYLSNMSILERYNINLIPFVDYYKNNISVKGVIRNVGGNLILLSPFIFYLCIINRINSIIYEYFIIIIWKISSYRRLDTKYARWYYSMVYF